ncbi:MAG TPA: MarR family transcriptional regulator [Polyangiales bacterium]|jgi:DNA-binding MarR family transcriptional regulator|nr:MarR family transcriptional regulator [Polyangiales bacterium]
MTEPSAEVIRVLDDLRRIVRALRSASRAAEVELGVTGAQLFVLKTLAASPRIALSELAARTRTDQSTVSGVVKRLVEAGFVARATGRDDRRRIELTPTTRGRAILRRAPNAAQESLIEGLERLPKSERSALASALRSLVNAMRLEDEAPQMFFEDDKS